MFCRMTRMAAATPAEAGAGSGFNSLSMPFIAFCCMTAFIADFIVIAAGALCGLTNPRAMTVTFEPSSRTSSGV
jgi:hypothetical protein